VKQLHGCVNQQLSGFAKGNKQQQGMGSVTAAQRRRAAGATNPNRTIRNTVCERLLPSFMRVAPTWRLASPSSSSCKTWCVVMWWWGGGGGGDMSIGFQTGW